MQLLFRPLSTSKEKGLDRRRVLFSDRATRWFWTYSIMYFLFMPPLSLPGHVSCIIWPSIISKGRKQGCFSKGNFTQSIILKKRVFLLKKQNLLSLHLDSSQCGKFDHFSRCYLKSILVNFIKEL